jgi:hypothetical protein
MPDTETKPKKADKTKLIGTLILLAAVIGITIAVVFFWR